MSPAVVVAEAKADAAHAQAQLTHPKYRPDIDGLRAVAVLSVVAFHAFPGWIPGGFIGVDVFFVISGYLISTIIFENLDRGTFSFYEFYARRVKRIFPALLVVLVATFAFGWIALVADEFKQLGKHVAAGAGFVSNIVLWGEAGYFDNSAETKPLLHLWSLGIEEQYYIVWPLMLWLAWKRKFSVLGLAAIVVAASFILNIREVNSDPVAAFYSPQTRFWELLCGSLLAWMVLHKNKRTDALNIGANLTVANVVSVLGFCLLVIGFFWINKDSTFPGGWAAVPVLGSVLFIAAGPRAWLNRLVLSNPVAVWFGLISFPLYLWHWPLLSYARIIAGETPGRTVRMCAVIAAIVLAWLTYKVIERPIRLGQHSNLKVAVLAALMLCFGVVGYQTYLHDGISSREAVAVNQAIGVAGYDGGDGGYLAADCGLQPEQSGLFQFCKKDTRGNVKYALLGDSKATVFYTGLVRTSTDAGRWMFIGGNSKEHGPPVPIISSEPEFAMYQKLTGMAVDAIAKDEKIEVVAIVAAIRSVFGLSDGIPRGGNVDTYDYKYLERLGAAKNYDKVYSGFKETISRLVKTGKKVVLVVDNPTLPEARDCQARKTSIGVLNRYWGLDSRGTNKDCYVPLSKFNEQISLYRKLLAELRDAFPGSVSVLDATDLYCDKEANVCGPNRNGRLMYAYTDHISDYAAGLVGARLNASLGK